MKLLELNAPSLEANKLSGFVEQVMRAAREVQVVHLKQVAKEVFDADATISQTEVRKAYYKFRTSGNTEMHPYTHMMGDEVSSPQSRRQIADLISKGHDYVRLTFTFTYLLEFSQPSYPAEALVEKFRTKLMKTSSVYVYKPEASLYDLHADPKKLKGHETRKVKTSMEVEIHQIIPGDALKKIFHKQLTVKQFMEEA